MERARRQQTDFIPARVRIPGLPDLFDLQGACGQCPQEISLVARLLQPCGPVGTLQHDHLPIMNWRDIWTRIGRQQREGFTT